VDILADGEAVTDPEIRSLLRTAAIFHDCGFFEQYLANEPVAARIAAEVLPAFGYSAEQIKFIERLILATALGTEPSDLYEQIIKDADFDYLGRENYWETALKLKEEWAVMGKSISMPDWIVLQQKFLEGHHFYTSTAQKLRGPGKANNLAMVKAMMNKQ
jgi:predicted metal-dependent HD superfamily phosphohydrolase